MRKNIVFMVAALLAAVISLAGSAPASAHTFSHLHHAHFINHSARRTAHRGHPHARHRVVSQAGMRHGRRLRLAWQHHHSDRRGAIALQDAPFRRDVGLRKSFARSAAGFGAQVGGASYYYGGGRTATGGSVGAATCAHRTLPFGTRVLVTNLANARQEVLTVNDRGPFAHGRILDVSRTAAGVLGMLQSGVARIRMEVIGGRG